MKRNLLVGVAALLLSAGLVWAVTNPTPTPIVTPPETGEDSLHAGEVFNMARFKPGMCTVSVTVSGATAAGTCNGASGQITSAATTAGASGATPSVITITNNKVNAADIVICQIDKLAGAAGSALVCNTHETASTVVFTIQSASTTALTSATITISFLVITSGNPN
jgi:hypothetical protein